MIKIAFFDTKEYDKKFFNKYNEDYGYQITYFESNLNTETAPLTKGFDAVCIFVHDKVDKETLLKIDNIKDIHGSKFIGL